MKNGNGKGENLDECLMDGPPTSTLWMKNHLLG
jgi:hypothetical protein